MFEVPFAVDAEIPLAWECKFDGTVARLVDGSEPEPKKAKPPRTHWDMLLERRTIADLEEVLAERLEVLRWPHPRVRVVSDSTREAPRSTGIAGLVLSVTDLAVTTTAGAVTSRGGSISPSMTRPGPGRRGRARPGADRARPAGRADPQHGRPPAGQRPADQRPAEQPAGRTAAGTAAPSTSVTKPGQHASAARRAARASRRGGLRPGGRPSATAALERPPGPAALPAQQPARRAASGRAASSSVQPMPIQDETTATTAAISTAERSRSDAQQDAASGSASSRPSRLSARGPATAARGEREPPDRDPPQRLAHDRRLILLCAALPLGERDRHLDDPEAGPPGAPGQVDLEAVALRGDRRPASILSSTGRR